MKNEVSSPLVKDLDQRLDAALQSWQGIEPRSDFEQCVWRGIRSGSAAPARGMEHMFWIQSHPAWAGTLAASLAIMVGIAVGLGTAREPTPRADLRSVMHGQTLAASYLTLVSGEAR